MFKGHYIRINPKNKMLLLADDISIFSHWREDVNGIKYYQIYDNELIYLLYNFNRYKKGYLIRLDKDRGEIDLPDTKIRGEILLEEKRQNAADIVKYIKDIRQYTGSIKVLRAKYPKLGLLLMNKKYDSSLVQKHLL
jgi:hypothetical protein